MKLSDLVRRPQPPAAWVEGDNIPWDDPGFSVRMLAEHLSQSHDAASRRFHKIESQVAWIHDVLLGGTPTRVLDLCCGPGLYTERLAALGHQCVGIDYSPASIAYAREQAMHKRLRCVYKEADIRRAEFGTGIGLAMMIFGEFNTLHPETAKKLLQRVWGSLAPGGKLLLEPHTYDGVRQIADTKTHWQTAGRGLFSDNPHTLLEEQFWDAWRGQLTTRYYVIDADTAEVTRFARSMQAYTNEDYAELLTEVGFVDVALYASLGVEANGVHDGLMAIAGRKD